MDLLFNEKKEEKDDVLRSQTRRKGNGSAGIRGRGKFWRLEPDIAIAETPKRYGGHRQMPEKENNRI